MIPPGRPHRPPVGATGGRWAGEVRIRVAFGGGEEEVVAAAAVAAVPVAGGVPVVVAVAAAVGGPLTRC